MKIYMLSYTDHSGEHKGYSFHPSARDLRKHAAQAKRNDQLTVASYIDVAPTKAGILRALNIYAGHPDNG